MNNYIQTARYCYQIGNHFVATDNETLANAFFSMKQLDTLNEARFLFLLADVKVNFKRFAKEFCNIEKDARYFAVDAVMKKAIDKYYESGAGNSVIEIMHSCLPDLVKFAEDVQKPEYRENNKEQEADEGKSSSEYIWKINRQSDGPMELRVQENVTVNDRSMTNTCKKFVDVKFDELAMGKRISVGGETVTVVEFSKHYVKLEWLGNTYTVHENATLTTNLVRRENIYVSCELACMEFDYHHDTIPQRVNAGVNEVGDIQAESESSIHNATGELEEEVLKTLDYLIYVEEKTELILYKALLESCNDWNTFVIVRGTMFKQGFEQAVNCGCFKHDFTWNVLDVAAMNNAPETFMDDMDAYYDLLATGTESGNDIARDIMNRIWEPENIIEED